MGAMVRVLGAGVFNGPGHRALPGAEAGSVIEVADGEYAGRLAAMGLVEEALTSRPPLPKSGEGEPGPSEAQVARGPGARKRRMLER